MTRVSSVYEIVHGAFMKQVFCTNILQYIELKPNISFAASHPGTAKDQAKE